MNQSVNKIDPRSMQPMEAWAKAVALYESGNWKDAEAFCIRTLEGIPGHVEARLLRGIFALVKRECYLGLSFLSGLEDYLKEGQHVTYYINLTKAYVELQRFKEAVEAGEKAVELAPENENALVNLGTAYRGLEETEKALEVFKRLEKVNPDNPVSYLMQGVLFQDKKSEKDFARAEEFLKKAFEMDKTKPQCFLWLAGILQTRGKFDEMREVLKECLEKFPENSGALAMVVEDGKVELNQEQLTAAEKRTDHPETSYAERILLNYGLSRLFHKKKDYFKAFKYLQKGNDLRSVERPYRPQQQQIFTNRVVHLFTSDMVERAVKGPSDPAPIFVVSMPRSGSTMLEQILASHSKVTGAGELPLISEILREVDVAQPLHNLTTQEDELKQAVEEAVTEKLPSIGQRYLERVRAEYPFDTPFVVDKMPGNVQWAGLIALALPRAKIIHIRRDWRDTCWSCYRQNFAEGQNFSYKLDYLKHFYKQYARLIQHWQSLLPDRIVEVNYGDIIDDFENQVRNILNYCGLEFEESCLSFHEHSRSVRTASVRQVRQPVNRKGMQTWKPYEEFLKEWLEGPSPWDEALKEREDANVR